MIKNLAIAATLMLSLDAFSETITTGNVTAVLGPDFFLDDATTGGGDFSTNNATFDRTLNGIWAGTQGSVISITGIGWASPGNGITATQALVTITYLGANGVFGGGDDVIIGSTSDRIMDVSATGREYAWRFDTAMTNAIDGSNGVFRINIAAMGTGSFTFKTTANDKLEASDVKLSVAGTSVALGDPIELLQDGGFEALTGTLPGTNTAPWASVNEMDEFDVTRETNVVYAGSQSLRLGYNFRNNVVLSQNIPPVNSSLHYALTYWIRSATTNNPTIRVEFLTKPATSTIYTIARSVTNTASSTWTPCVLYIASTHLTGRNGHDAQVLFRRQDNLGSVFIDDASLQVVGAIGLPITNLYGLPPHFQHPNGGYLPKMFPFIDRFGQYKHDSWEEKITNEAHLVSSATEEEADIAAKPGPPEWTIYGGWENGPTLAATGYFRVQKYNGKWWFVDPLGKLYFSHGMTGINTDSQGTRINGREGYFEGLPEVGDPDYGFIVGDLMFHEEANAFRKYGPDWPTILSDLAHRRLRSWGMNTIAAWSSTNIYMEKRTPYNQVLFPGSSMPLATGFPDYFHPNFAVNVAAALTNAVAQGIAEDPWCLGLFIHNELTWARPGAAVVNDVAKFTLVKGATQPAKIAFRNMLQAAYTNISALNLVWGTSYSTWTNFLSVTNLPNETLATPDYEAFYTLYAENYYRTVKEQFEVHAPNTLYLGSRFTSNPFARAAAASAKFADVSSYHPYTTTPNVPQAFVDADRPVLISEWQFAAKDTGLFGDAQRLANPPTQGQRAISYKAYANVAIDNPYLVGVHWFFYVDRSAGGDGVGEFPGANYNIGFMTVGNVPYRKIVEASREIGATMYGRRYGSFPPSVVHTQSSYADIEEATPFPIPLIIADDTSAASNLVLSGWSSNTNFIPNSGIAFTGAGSNRILQITPSDSSHAGGYVTVVVTDQSGVRSETPIFVLQGRPAAFLEFMSETNVLLSWMSISNVEYHVQSTPNLIDWSVNGDGRPGTDSLLTTVVDTANPLGLYRIKLDLP